jgi:hypothetical protein
MQNRGHARVGRPPGAWKYRILLGTARASWRLGREAEAIKLLEEVEAGSNEWEDHESRGALLELMNRPEEALEAYRLSLDSLLARVPEDNAARNAAGPCAEEDESRLADSISRVSNR